MAERAGQRTRHDANDCETVLCMTTRNGETHLPRTLELDDLVAVLVDVDLFLRVVTSILDEDEQECADEPGEGVPFHGRVPPCAREPLGREKHAGSGRGRAGVESEG
jgi:hypothetical protein